MIAIRLLALALAGLSPLAAQDDVLRYTGVNLSGAEFAGGQLPGIPGSTYTYPTADEMAYFRAKGMTCFRIPFLWERLQRKPSDDLDPAEWARLRGTVQAALDSGAAVVVDPHSYARYAGKLIDAPGGPTRADFADLWRRLALRWKGEPRVLFGLMNEPHSMKTEDWLDDANAAIAAIRATGADNLILVPGNAWTGAHSWGANWYGSPNATVMLGVVDPLDRYAYEVHQYVDNDFSGTSTNSVKNDDPMVGAKALAGFTGWLREHGKRGFLGEFATPRTAVGLGAADRLLEHIDANRDVWIGWTWWSAGPWWGGYEFSVEPDGARDQPQMAVLSRHAAREQAPPSDGKK